MRRALALGAGVAVLAGCGGGGGDGGKAAAQPQVQQTQTTKVEVVKPSGSGSATTGFDPQTIYRTESQGVVTLIALGGGKGNLFDRSTAALGSGFVIDAEGYVATNAHVITTASGARAKQIYVAFGDGNQLSARIVGADPDSDVGLVKIDPSKLRGPRAKLVPLPFGSTGELRPGDPVAAIGSPFDQRQSLTVGVVSATGRDIQSLTNFDISNAIQTDAAINHGNSGGPLLDRTGKVIGINSQISSTSGGGEGVGFAIPIETVKHSLDALRAKGSVDYAYLGIRSVPLYPQLAERLGLHALTGALIDDVESGGPAEKAGIRGARDHIAFQGVDKIPVGGDLITGVDGHKLATAQDLSDVIGLHQPGDVVHLQVLRGNEKRTVAVTLAKRPEKLAGAR